METSSSSIATGDLSRAAQFREWAKENGPITAGMTFLFFGAGMILATALSSASPNMGNDTAALHIVAGAGVFVLGVALLVLGYRAKKKEEKQVDTTEQKLADRVRPWAFSAYKHLLGLAFIVGLGMILQSQWDATHNVDVSLANTIGVSALSSSVGLSIVTALIKRKMEAKQAEATEATATEQTPAEEQPAQT